MLPRFKTDRRSIEYESQLNRAAISLRNVVSSVDHFDVAVGDTNVRGPESARHSLSSTHRGL